MTASAMHRLKILTTDMSEPFELFELFELFDMTLATAGDSLIRQSKAIPVIGIASTAAKQRTTTTISNVFNILFSVQRPLSSGKHESQILNTVTTGISYALLVYYF
jgi:hypothetical protein